jgi:L-ascorbate metabolism protein UlaG (beta-lactamase superfamily)
MARAGLIHGGDALWHGYWWQIAERCGLIDLALLPINAAVATFDYLARASVQPAVLTPEQAAAAAHVLQTRLAAPSHYGRFHKPPLYIRLPDPESSFAVTARRREVATWLARPGDERELGRTMVA